MVELCRPAGDLQIEIAEAQNAVGFLRRLGQLQIVPKHLKRGIKVHNSSEDTAGEAPGGMV